jgi:Mg-chelatase subunit ChlD
MKALRYLVIVVLPSILDGCHKASINAFDREIEFEANYTFPQGQGLPILSFIKVPKILKLDEENPQADTGFHIATVNFKNVRISDYLGNYEIDLSTVTTEEKRKDDFKFDSENSLHVTQNRSFDVVMVLDFSSSLGTDVDTVRRYALEFVDSIFALNKTAQIGVVGFAYRVDTMGLTGDKTTIKSFIDKESRKSEDATKLFEAIDMGVTLISKSIAESKAIFVFTDGANNSQSKSIYEKEDYLLANLSKSYHQSKIAVYTIGLQGKGDFDEKVLGDLAVNGGIKAVPESSEELGAVFQKFANNMSKSYSFTYRRNDSHNSTPIPLRFKMKILLL